MPRSGWRRTCTDESAGLTSSEVDVAPSSEFAADVAYYLSLTPRQLPSRYLYDDLGSALFEAICRLPWYTITRAETRLLRAHGDEILASVPSLANIVELGPGNGEKLRLLLHSSGFSSRRSPSTSSTFRRARSLPPRARSRKPGHDESSHIGRPTTPDFATPRHRRPAGRS